MLFGEYDKMNEFEKILEMIKETELNPNQTTELREILKKKDLEYWLKYDPGPD